MTSRRFWTIVLLLLAAFDLAVRFWLDFEFAAVLKAESFLFVTTALILYTHLRREHTSEAWPQWIRSLIVAGLLLAGLRAGAYSLGLDLALANLAVLAVAIIAGMVGYVRRRLSRP